MTITPHRPSRIFLPPPHHHADFRYTGLSFSTVNAVEFQSVSKSYLIGLLPPDRPSRIFLPPPHHHADFRYTGLSFSTVNAVEFQSVSKSYAIYDSPGDRLKELLSLNRVRCHKDFLALDDVTFQVKRGETFCIVGENGSGKSTALQNVAGILQPSRAAAIVTGRVSALLELGAGFNPEFSGRDNVYLNGSILGLTT